jgi:hypothetical protein
MIKEEIVPVCESRQNEVSRLSKDHQVIVATLFHTGTRGETNSRAEVEQTAQMALFRQKRGAREV